VAEQHRAARLSCHPLACRGEDGAQRGALLSPNIELELSDEPLRGDATGDVVTFRAARVDRQILDGAADRLTPPVTEEHFPTVIDLHDAHARVLHDGDGIEAGAKGFRKPLLRG